MPGARFGNCILIIAIFGLGRHLLSPVFPVAVIDTESDRRSERFSPANSRPDLNLIFFDEHSAAAAVSLLTAPQIVVDLGCLDRKAGGHAIDDHCEAWAVRFAGSEIAQHDSILQ